MVNPYESPKVQHDNQVSQLVVIAESFILLWYVFLGFSLLWLVIIASPARPYVVQAIQEVFNL